MELRLAMGAPNMTLSTNSGNTVNIIHTQRVDQSLSCWRMMVSCLPRPFFHLYLSHFYVCLCCSCITSKPHFHTTFHPLTSSSYLLLLSFYSVFLIAGLCPGLFLGVSALIKRPSARISLQPEPTCIFQLLNSDCRQVVTFSLYLLNCSTQTAVCLYL